MTLLVTGGTGFVMSVVAREWLDRDPQARAVILDRSGLDVIAEKFFAPVRDRLTVLTADILDPTQWAAALDAHGITAIVHGATVTPNSRPSDPSQPPEANDPATIVDVNLMGTVRMLEWARGRPSIKRFVYVSSGSVYRHNGPDWSGEPLPEDGYVAPLTLYGISKFAAEMVTNRYADLFGLSAISVRLSSVYGPMDRVTASRNFRHVPNRIAHMALDGVQRVRVNTLDAVGDYIHVEDVASAIAALLRAPRLRFSAYNVACGATASIGELVGWAAEKVPGFGAELAPAEQADIVQDASLKDGMWGAYDISRIGADTGWKPRPMREALHAYMDWLASERDSGTRQEAR